MAHRLAICNRKGGTGKTTVSVNIAAEMASRGLRVLLIDLDPQCHCAAGVGMNQSGPTVHDVFHRADVSLNQAIQRTGISGLWLATADPCFDHSLARTGHLPLPEALTKSGADDCFDLIVLDTPPSLDPLLINALASADSVVVPFIPHQLSMLGVRQLVQQMYTIKSSHNPSLTLAGFLPNLASQTMRHHKRVMQDIEIQFGAGRLLPSIRSDIRLAEAFASGQPVRLFSPGSGGAHDFVRLAAKLAEKIRA